MKICLINNTFEPFTSGGAETVIKTIAQALIKRNYEVFIISTRPALFNKQRQRLNNASKSLGFKIYFLKSFFYSVLKMPKIFRLPWHFFNMINFISYLKIKKIITAENPDIIISNNLIGLGFLIPKLIHKFNIKHIQIIHDIQFIHPSGLMIKNKEDKINSLFSKVYQLITCRLITADAVVSPSSWLLNLYQKYNFFAKAEKFIIPNPAIMRPEGIKKNKNDHFFKFLFVGKITEEKGASFLVKAFNDFILQANVKLLIVGPGEFSARMSKLIKNNSRIEFLGRLGNNNVIENMQSCDCLILPSLCYENSPTVIYEAASIGLPAIASDIGGSPELINSIGGIIFKAGDSEDLIKKMNWATKNPLPVKNIAENLRAQIDNCSVGNYINKLERIF
ncbi:MAG: glycosyltransferase [Patescibacteria group bacterium]|nr:glycosyltransferase [Patescibacteria group bacterium]